MLDDDKHIEVMSQLPSMTNRFDVDCWTEPSKEQLQDIGGCTYEVDCQEAIKLYKNINCGNIGSFIDVMKMYRHHIEKVSWLAERRIVSLEKAIKKYEDT